MIEVKAYMYLDNDIIYISPEEDDTIIYANENCERMFYDSKTKIIDLFVLNTSNVTNMQHMFYFCQYLTEIKGLENFNTSNVTDMHWMFSSCNSLTSLNVSNFNTSNVTDMYWMFSSCSSLVSLDLSNFNTYNVTDMEMMFNQCYNLSGNITIMNSNITNYSNMFNSCSTNTNSKFTVNYKSGCKEVAQAMVNTKSSSSKVVLGTQV